VTIHRFKENIGGRPYLIEVRPVSNKWRAQLLRAPGVPAAMMPFYGVTHRLALARPSTAAGDRGGYALIRILAGG
jgi:hypothetical protein